MAKIITLVAFNVPLGGRSLGARLDLAPIGQALILLQYVGILDPADALVVDVIQHGQGMQSGQSWRDGIDETLKGFQRYWTEHDVDVPFELYYDCRAKARLILDFEEFLLVVRRNVIFP